MKTALITAALFVMALPTAFADTAAKSSEWTISKTDMAIVLPNRSYTSEIRRGFQNKHENELLRKAEATYPQREVVLNAMKDAHYKMKKTPPADEPLWWSSSFDNVKIPYAITASAVKYYDNLISAFNKEDFSGSNNIKMITAELKYRSRIEYHDKWTYGVNIEGTLAPGSPAPKPVSYEKVYIAELNLEWSQYCGNVCAMDFHKKRIVVLDKKGNILAVYGDGNTGVAVS